VRTNEVNERFLEQNRRNELETERQKQQLRLEADLELARQVQPLKIEQQRAEIEGKRDLGVYTEQFEKNKEATIAVGNKKWDTIGGLFTSFGNGVNNLTSDPKRMALIGGAVVATAVGIYAAKNGLPVLFSYLLQPSVVSETSKKSLFGWTAPRQDLDINNLYFNPTLQERLMDTAMQVQTASEFNENLPNVLFWGPPGTGKTAFAKALAYISGMDYALTSGSEFAKITDLNIANKELSKLLEWGANSSKGLIIFIDEAESLFANRKLPSTSKAVQDFINTFLSKVSEKSQKNVMFIFATNHPFKLDDAVTNRVGINVEFTLPEQKEREMILEMYVKKLAKENKEAVVTIAPEVLKNIPAAAELLIGQPPRALKFIAEQMIIYARRTPNKELTIEIAQKALLEAKDSYKQAMQWAADRDEWLNAQVVGPKNSNPVIAG
jgi:ATPase family AAA domain-containing protein 3A/B